MADHEDVSRLESPSYKTLTKETATLDDLKERFRDWLQERAESDQSHSYTRSSADRWFAKGKDVDRSYIEDCGEFSTILITYCHGLPQEGETIAEHADRFLPRKIRRKRRSCLKRAGAFDGYSGISVLAPKSPDRVPHASAPFTHQHDFIWTRGHISEQAFDGLNEYDGWDIDVSIEHQTSSEVETPDSVLKRGSGLDEKRGDTTDLPQELAGNLPMLTCRFDARGAPEYVQEWCASLRAGTDYVETSGISRFQQLGEFADRAARMKAARELSEGVANAQALSSELEYHTLPHHNQNSSDTQDSSESSFDLSESPPVSPITCSDTRYTFSEGRVPHPPAPSEESAPSFDFIEDRSASSRFDLAS